MEDTGDFTSHTHTYTHRVKLIGNSSSPRLKVNMDEVNLIFSRTSELYDMLRFDSLFYGYDIGLWVFF